MDMLKNNITAIVLAAGQGTRMKSRHPKVLHQIMGRPLIAYLLDTLGGLGLQDILVVVGYEADKVKEVPKDFRCALSSRSPSLHRGLDVR